MLTLNFHSPYNNKQNNCLSVHDLFYPGSTLTNLYTCLWSSNNFHRKYTKQNCAIIALFNQLSQRVWEIGYASLLIDLFHSLYNNHKTKHHSCSQICFIASTTINLYLINALTFHLHSLYNKPPTLNFTFTPHTL